MEVGGGRPSIEKLWESTTVAQGSPQALICIGSSGGGSHPLPSAPTRSTSDTPLISHSAIMETRTFVTRPKPVGCEEPVPLSCRRNDAASDYSFVTSGGTSNVMKVLFHKK